MKKQLLQDNLSYIKGCICIIRKFLREVCSPGKETAGSFFKHWKLFHIFFKKDRLLIIAALFCAFILGCKKEINTSYPITILPLPIPIIPIKITASICIYSYNQLISELGVNEISVRAVQLSNGTIINVGNGILSITYKAINYQERTSLFRSELIIDYNFYGYPQENTMNCWSLGCVYQNSGIPPFTSILKGRKVLLINTSLYWNIPGVNGQIKYLIID